jgi:GntR family transcriptional regulator / MocR family aminotransferase
MDETSQPLEMLLSISRDGPGTLGSQIEDQLRNAIRDGALRPGTRVPSTRDLARQLGISRRVAVDAYAQLAAEGYLVMRQGARPHVSQAAGAAEPAATAAIAAPRALPPRHDFRPSTPDVSLFPRQAWLRCMREGLGNISDAELAYGDPRGVQALRTALADYLGRVRGAVADPERIVVTCGYSQGLGLVCRALAQRGARRIAFEDPSFPEQRLIAGRAGLEPVAVPVDERGIRVDELRRADADVVALTPAHQHPTGVVLAGDRRTDLLAWLRERDGYAIDDDYDAEYRYDRAAVGALQGLDPDRIVYAGSASKALTPGIRIGWLVLPPALLGPVRDEKLIADRQTDVIGQHTFAVFLARGELDRHLRRLRSAYRARRDALVAALAEELPDATVRGIAAGLHATVELRADDDEDAIVAAIRARRIAIDTMAEHWAGPRTGPPMLLLGYGQVAEVAIRPGIRTIAEAVRAARTGGG